MRIDPSFEEPARELFGFAIRAELEQFAEKLRSLDEERLTGALRLAVLVAGRLVLDVTEGEQPSDADLRKMAETAAEVETRYSLDEEKVHTFLARGVFGDAALEEVFSPVDVATVPFLVTGNLLGSYTSIDEGQEWWEYLDQIEAAIEAAAEPSG